MAGSARRKKPGQPEAKRSEPRPTGEKVIAMIPLPGVGATLSLGGVSVPLLRMPLELPPAVVERIEALSYEPSSPAEVERLEAIRKRVAQRMYAARYKGQ